MNQFIKFLSFLLISLVILTLGLFLFSQTRLFKNWLKNQIVSAVQSNIQGTIEVGALNGNLFTRFQLEGLTLRLEDKTIARVERVSVIFNPLALLARKIVLQEILIKAPEFELIRDDAGRWNFQRLLDAQEQRDVTSDFTWEIEASDIQISAGEATITRSLPTKWVLPKKIQNLSLKMGFWMDDRQMSLSLRNLRFDAREPDLVVRTFRSHVQYAEDRLQVKGLEIETESSRLVASLDVQDLQNPVIDFSAKGARISLREVRRAVPALELYGDPRVDITAIGPLNDLNVHSDIRVGGSTIEIKGRLQARDLPYSYDLIGKVESLNLAEITDQGALDTDLNFRFNLQGQDLHWGSIASRLVVDLDSSRVFGKRLGTAHVLCEIAHDSLDMNAEVSAEGAKLSLSGRLVSGEANSLYRARADIQRLDLAPWLERQGLSSDLNLTLQLRGQGLDLASLVGNLEIRLHPSSVNQVPVDSALFSFKMQHQMITFREFRVSSPLGKLVAEGNVSIQKESDFKLEADFIDFSLLSKVMPVDSLYGKGHLMGHVAGPMDSLTVLANLDLFQSGVDQLAVEGLRAELSGLRSDGQSFLQLHGQVFEAAAYGVDRFDASFAVGFRNSSAQFHFQLGRGEEFAAEAEGVLKSNEPGYDIALKNVDIRFLGQRWQKRVQDTHLRIANKEVQISGLDLTSQEQLFSIFGRFDVEESSHLSIKLKNLDISKYRSYLAGDVDLTGRFDFDLLFSGPLASPRIQTSFRVTEGHVLQVPIEMFYGNLDVHERTLNWDCLLSKSSNDSLFESSGYLPVDFSLDPFEFKLLEKDPLLFKFKTRGLDLSILQAFSRSVQNIEGTLAADIVLTNTLTDLRGVGPIRLVKGQFDIPKLGTQYRNVNLALVLKEKEVVIRDLSLHAGKGELRLVEGGLSLTEKSLKDFNAKFKMENFQIINNRKMQAAVRGDLELSGSVQAPYFGGELTVTESRIYYSAWSADETLQLSPAPFFVIVPDSTEADTTGARSFQKTIRAPERDYAESLFYRGLHGELTVFFPRNTWVRGKDANIEVEGELVLIKQDEEVLLFGSLSAIRGHYDLLGKRFQVTRGELLFAGEPEPNPEIDIEAIYEFRNVSGEDREKHEFKVFVTGTFYAPQFKFTLDEQEAKQEDILSILIFGKSVEDLSFGQRNTVSGSDGLDKQARGFVTGQLLQALTGKLGQELRLDVIQIESGKDFEDTRLRIGKYVTPDVFVSVSQDFGEEGNQKVELEYEIPKKLLFFNLLLQASQERKGDSGLDVIWKIEW